MKRLFSLFLMAFIAIGLIACDSSDTREVEIPETLAMADVDNYLFNADWQFVDVRDFDDQMADGWIRGFEIIPFFQYLEYTNILVRETGWSFTPSNIKDENALRALFDEDKVIVIMCAAGTRAGFVKDALLHLGYENVFNVGGLSAYNGENRVHGDGSFNIDLPHPATINPLPAEIDMSDELIDIYVSRDDVQFVDLRNFSNILDGWHRGAQVIPFFDFLEADEILVRVDGWNFSPDAILNEEALRTLFCPDKNIILFCAGGTRAEFVKLALEELGYENVWNAGAFRDYAGSQNSNDGGCE